MARLVMVQGEGEAEHLIDLDKNPWADDLIAAGALTVVATLGELPPDPWGQKPRRAKAAGDREG